MFKQNDRNLFLFSLKILWYYVYKYKWTKYIYFLKDILLKTVNFPYVWRPYGGYWDSLYTKLNRTITDENKKNITLLKWE